MSSYVQPKIKAFVAGADLSAKQFHFVKLQSGTNVTFSGAGEKAVGVLMNKDVKSGDDAEVAHLGGGALVKLAGTVAAGDSIASDANGAGVVAGAATWAAGVAMEAGVAGDVISVLLNGHNTPA